MWKRGINIRQISPQGPRKLNEHTPMERKIEIHVGEAQESFWISPGSELDLCLGYLRSRQRIANAGDVSLVETSPGIFKADILKKPLFPKQKVSSLSISPTNVYALTAYFQQKSMLYKDTSMSHSVGLASPTAIQFFCEDLQASHAFYKALGQALSAGEDGAGKILLTTGYLDLELVKNAHALGIEILISRFGPTDKGMDFALANEMTLIGFFRGTRFNLYCGQACTV